MYWCEAKNETLKGHPLNSAQKQFGIISTSWNVWIMYSLVLTRFHSMFFQLSFKQNVVSCTWCKDKDTGKRTILTFSSLCPSWVWWSPLPAELDSARALLQSFSVWTYWVRRPGTSSCPPVSSSRPGGASSDGQTSRAATWQRQRKQNCCNNQDRSRNPPKRSSNHYE